MRFGEYIRHLRTGKRLKLREFCLQFGHDPSNWSKIERGEMPPPDSLDTIKLWASQLGLAEGSAEWHQFCDLAFQEKGKIPSDILNNERLVETLPLFFRTLRGQKPSEEELNKLIELLRKGS